MDCGSQQEQGSQMSKAHNQRFGTRPESMNRGKLQGSYAEEKGEALAMLFLPARMAVCGHYQPVVKLALAQVEPIPR